MATTTIKINGMTCDHCVKRVTKEISTIPGVSTVAVDLAAGTATFDSENDIPVSYTHLTLPTILLV